MPKNDSASFVSPGNVAHCAYLGDLIKITGGMRKFQEIAEKATAKGDKNPAFKDRE